jgi:outer membrane protein OmpA-like peptidoglycan-associated protein
MKTISALLLCAGFACAQVPNPTQSVPQSGQSPQVESNQSMPIYRVTVVRRTASAINYRHRGGATKVDFRGTELLPQARGEAKVESKQGYIEVEVEFDNLQPASRFGPEYLTYTLWAITPEGRSANLGEILLNGNKSKLNVTTELQSFGLIVTAEPYFAVTQPSDVVVMENVVRTDTRGKVDVIEANYELLRRGQYTMNVSPGAVRPVAHDPKVPLELLEARNAIQIARWAGADRYAGDVFNKADQLLSQAEAYQARKAGKRSVVMTAREAVQRAEDSRLITVRRQEEERLAQERQAAAEREAQAKARAAEAAEQRRLEAERRARAEEQRALAESDRRAAERAQAEAEAAAQRARLEAENAARLKAEAEAARQAALAEQQRAQEAAERARLQAEEADRLRERAEADRERVRKQLLEQLNKVLETRESARGLIVNMSDVLFEFGKYNLKPEAREKLARVSGIVMAHPGLRLEVEGHTDSIGSEAFNQKLSEQRAGTVRDYLVESGLDSQSITARGFGKMQPVASNDTASGRQANRRVELVVSGDIINTELDDTVPVAPSTPPTATPPQL